MNLRRLFKFKRSQPDIGKPLLSDEEGAKLKAALEPTPALPKQPKGRVIKRTRHAEFNPNPNRRGGRIVKAMPRELQKIKQAQEMVEDDEPITQIED